MKRKTVANIIMVAVILLIAAAGVLGVGHIRGWFDRPDDTQATLLETKGVVNLTRDGVSTPTNGGIILRGGDKLTCQSGASAVISAGDDRIILGEKAEITVTEPSAHRFAVQVLSGEVFAHCEVGAMLTFDDRQIQVLQATALLSVRSGAQSVSVFRGSVENIPSGQVIHYAAGTTSVEDLVISNLNDFTIAQLREFESAGLCFTSADLDLLEAQRQQAIADLLDNPASPQDPPADPPQDTSGESDTPDTPDTSDDPDPVTPTDKEPNTENPPPTDEVTPPDDPTTVESITPPVTMTCTISISCTAVLGNMEELDPSKAGFVPSSGVILYPVTVSFSEGETVFDVLSRVCTTQGIQLEYRWTPLFGSYYIEGIHNLYEFDCGMDSGWTYQVNGWSPNYGCSDYTLVDGDIITWTYTC